MKLSRHQDIRALLLAAEDGLTARELSAKLDTHECSIRRAMPAIYGVYIDRWQKQKGRGPHSAVYMCVEVPENTPKPGRKT